MDTMSAFMMGEMNRHKEEMVFDWELAARIIKMRSPGIVRAGLREDWEYTGGRIWEDGKPVDRDDTYVFLASTWAVPEIEIDGELMECYRMQSDTPGWNARTYWPPEALIILGLLQEGEIIEGEAPLSIEGREVKLLAAGEEA